MKKRSAELRLISGVASIENPGLLEPTFWIFVERHMPDTVYAFMKEKIRSLFDLHLTDFDDVGLCKKEIIEQFGCSKEVAESIYIHCYELFEQMGN